MQHRPNVLPVWNEKGGKSAQQSGENFSTKAFLDMLEEEIMLQMQKGLKTIISVSLRIFVTNEGR